MDSSADVGISDTLDEGNSFLDMELEALQSIYINELEVNTNEKSTTVSIDLHPSTADNLDEQYVRMTLQFILEEEYPDRIPQIKIRNPRGLSEEKINCVYKDLLEIAESKKGSSMLFEMIDAAKEHLTVGNRPSGECAICLYGFSETDVFTKTECYHYFHSHCLARYAKNFIENSKVTVDEAENKADGNVLLCPMCRIPIQFNETDINYKPPEESDDCEFVLTEEIKDLQQKMADLYQKQVEKGGIIDIEAEKNKYLLEISNVPTRLSNEEKSDQKLATEEDSVTDSKVETSDEVDSPSTERRLQVRDRNPRYDYRGRNRNFNRPNDYKGNYRSDYRYNKHSYADNYRGNYNKNRYSKRNSASSHVQAEETDLPEAAKNTVESREVVENEEQSNTQDASDNISETSEQASLESRSRNSSNFSPRYNRGARRGGRNYGNYHGTNRRPDKSNYHERHGSQASRRYTAMRDVEQAADNSEERGAKDVRTFDDSDRKNFRREEDYNTKPKYSDRNSQRGYNKGGYNRRDNYSNPHNNYSRNSKYSDYRDRDQYHAERDRNFREKRPYRDTKYQVSDDSSYDRYNKHGSKNYTGNRPGRFAGKSYAESSNNESESVELSSQSSDYKALREKDSVSNKVPESVEKGTNSLQKKATNNAAEKGPDKLTDLNTPSVRSEQNVFPEISNNIPQANSRTVNPPPGFANPLKKVIYGLQGANPPPGFNRS